MVGPEWWMESAALNCSPQWAQRTQSGQMIPTSRAPTSSLFSVLSGCAVVNNPGCVASGRRPPDRAIERTKGWQLPLLHPMARSPDGPIHRKLVVPARKLSVLDQKVGSSGQKVCSLDQKVGGSRQKTTISPPSCHPPPATHQPSNRKFPLPFQKGPHFSTEIHSFPLFCHTFTGLHERVRKKFFARPRVARPNGPGVKAQEALPYHEPRAKSQEPRAKSQEPRAKSQELSTRKGDSQCSASVK